MNNWETQILRAYFYAIPAPDYKNLSLRLALTLLHSVIYKTPGGKGYENSNEVSKLSGLGVRVLHHYDAVGFLKPAKVTEAGYGSEQLQRLQINQSSARKMHTILC